MNRNNIVGHVALALTLVLLAGIIGQMRRWEQERERNGLLVVRQPTIERAAGGGHLSAPAEVLVSFRPGTSVQEIEAIARRLNDRLEDRFEYVDNYAVIEDRDGIGVEQVLEQYRALPEVADAEANITIQLEPIQPRQRAASLSDEQFYSRALEDDLAFAPGASSNLRRLDEMFSSPNDPLFAEQWLLSNTGQREGRKGADISALAAWKRTKGSRDVVVAVLDSGVDYTHPDLVNNMWTRPANVAAYSDREIGAVDDVHGYDALANTGDPMDENGHGTHCAGIIGAEGDNQIGVTGVNWNVQIMPLKFMSKGGFGTTKAAIEAINYVIDRKRAGVNVRVISASWGSTARSKALEAAIRRAGEEGILFVAAAGNASADADRKPHYPASYKLPNVLSVAALNRNDELASFSNYGAKTVHIAAPGAEILSTWLGGEYREASGTSMATPEVSGIAALVLSKNPDITIEELRERLIRAVDRLDSLAGKVVSGGRINARRAVAGR